MNTVWQCRSPVSARPDPLTHYLVVRSDLPVGVAAAQIAHAAGESSPGDLRPGTFAIVLGVASETELRSVSARLRAAGVAHVEVLEPDAPYHGQLMAIGARPALRSCVSSAFANLPLYRGYAGVAQAESARKGDAGSCPAPRTTFLRRFLQLLRG